MMSLKNTQRKNTQHRVRRFAWVFGIPLVPLACYGFAAPFQQIQRPRSASGPVAEKFVKAVGTADWKTAEACYSGTPQLREQLSAQLQFPAYGSTNGFQFLQCTNYYLPFSGEHDLYTYTVHENQHEARLLVGVKTAGQTWKIDSVRLLPVN
jgi:hypothetical protein